MSRQSKVVGLNHDIYGAIPVAVVDQLPREKGIKEEMKAKLLEILGSEYILGHVFELRDLGLDELPRNSSDKVMKSVLVDNIVAQSLHREGST